MRLLLSPHHDDVLLSLPAWLCHWATDSDVHVAVVFSDEDDRLQEVCRALHLRLGVTVHELELAEARRRGVTARDCLRRWRTTRDLHPEDVERVTRRIAALAGSLPFRHIVAPGTLVHLDHALTRVAAERVAAAGKNLTLAFHADQPYGSAWPQALQLDGARIVREHHTVPRWRIVEILDALVGFVSRTDVRRILAQYGDGDDVGVEPLWIPQGLEDALR